MNRLPKIRLGHTTLIRVIAVAHRTDLREAEYIYHQVLAQHHSGSGVLMRPCFGGPVLRFPRPWEIDLAQARIIPCWVATYSYDPWREYREVKAVVDYARRGWAYDPHTRTKTKIPVDWQERLRLAA